MPRSGIRTPYASAVLRLVKSLRSGKEREFFFENSPREGTLSVLTPRTCVSAPSNLEIPAWYPVTSFVQPPVNAAGKKATTTFFLPRKSDSLIFLPCVEGNSKSGAPYPTLKQFFAACPCPTKV